MNFNVANYFPLSEPPSLEILIECMRMMLIIRHFEERSAQIYTTGQIRGFCHLSNGQEAISVGASFAMSNKDTMITAYRSRGHALARGISARKLMAELLGKKDGCSKGKGGSMHTFYKKNGFYGGHGIVGAQISLGTGLAFAHNYLKDGGVCLVFLGDGATNQGQFFESMNMASLWGLPVLYIIENNGYAMGTSVKRACAGGGLWKRGEPFGIPGFVLPGDDVISVYQVISSVLNHIRETSKPLIIELDTYRFKGHSMSDPGKYRTREELDNARQTRDPIQCLSAYLLGKGYLTSDEMQIFEDEAQAVVSDAYEFAEHSSEPAETEMLRDVLI